MAKRVGTDLVFYDGTCGLCHWAVRFLLARDPAGLRFRFAPLQGRTAGARLPQGAIRQDSLVVLRPTGPPLLKSQAVLQVLRTLGGGWRWLALVLGLLPRGSRDWAYDQVASRRHQLRPLPASLCPRVSPSVLERFLD